jgi:hypothetical protein
MYIFSQDFAYRPSFPTRGSARQRHSRTAVVRAGKDLQRVQVDEVTALAKETTTPDLESTTIPHISSLQLTVAF